MQIFRPLIDFKNFPIIPYTGRSLRWLTYAELSWHASSATGTEEKSGGQLVGWVPSRNYKSTHSISEER